MDVYQDAGGARPGTLIREYRQLARLTQQELADRSGLSVATVRDLEQDRSRRPRTTSLTALAETLGLDAGQSTTLAAAVNGTRPAPTGSRAPAGHSSGLWLAVLGPLTAWRDGLPLRLGPPRQVAVLGVLAVQPGKLVRRETIIDALWGQHPPATAPDLVRAYVSRLRRILDPAGSDRLLKQRLLEQRLLEHSAAGYRLRAGASELDAAAFGELVRQAIKAAATDAVAACGSFAQALELWRGEPAADVEVLQDHSVVQDLVRQRADVVLQYADAACGLGWHARVISLLETLAREQPLDERVHARLMVALAGTGQQAAAIRVHEDLRQRLDEQLGVHPGPELTKAHQRVLRQDIPPAENTTAATRPGPSARPRPARGMRCSLPPDTAAFTGRQAELDRMTRAAGKGVTVAVYAITGMPGVGKTAPAVHAAHVLKDRFPDRQLFLSLHAHTPGQQPVTPETALAGLLASVGIDARYLPRDLEGRAALWRDRMAGQKVLLVLDNAASSAQVAPLLPGNEGSLVLVTSRRQLGDLPGAATPVLLEALPAQEAREMFARLAPRAVASPPRIIAELAELAGRLPLAISLLARVYARHPSWTLADLAIETRAHMLTLAAENDSVAAAFGVSYQHLDPGLPEFFRRLSLHPGTSIDGYAAAALSGASLDEAVGQLDALYSEGLLTEAGHRRYGMHDLIRRYARDLAITDPPATQERALERLLNYYEYVATGAEVLLARQARPANPARGPRPLPAAVPSMTGIGQALAWARAERSSLIACLDHAASAGQHARVVALTAAMASLLRLDGPWNSAVTRHAAAVMAARQAGDRLGQANALTDLAVSRLATGDHRAAIEALREALSTHRDTGNPQGQFSTLTDLRGARRLTRDHPRVAEVLHEALGMFRDIGDRNGEAMALTYLGVVRLATGDHRGAAQALEEALSIYRDIDHRLGIATALTYLGDARLATGDHRGATEALEEALSIYRDIGDRGGEAMALNETGTLRQDLGNLGQAAEYHRQALDLARQISSPWDEAHALAGLGRCALADGHIYDGTAMLRQARDIFQQLSAPEAADVNSELGSLSGQENQQPVAGMV